MGEIFPSLKRYKRIPKMLKDLKKTLRKFAQCSSSTSILYQLKFSCKQQGGSRAIRKRT